MRQRICRFVSSGVGSGSIVGTVLILIFGPGHFVARVVVSAVLLPVLVPAMFRFYGNQQLWNWRCNERRKPRKDK